MYESTLPDISTRLRRRRSYHSVRWASRVSGISRTTLAELESGQMRDMRLATMTKLAAWLRISVEEITDLLGANHVKV